MSVRSLTIRNLIPHSSCRLGASAARRPWTANASGRIRLAPNLRRLYCTETQSTLENNSRNRLGFIPIILVSATCGVIGFGLGKAFDRPERAISSAPNVPAKIQSKDSSKEPTYGTPEDFDSAIRELRATFPSGEYVSTDPDDLHTHGFSENDYHPGMYCCISLWMLEMNTSLYHKGVEHSVVVYPQTTEDVVKIVKIAVKYRMPIIVSVYYMNTFFPLKCPQAYSGATSLEGHFRGVGTFNAYLASCA